MYTVTGLSETLHLVTTLAVVAGVVFALAQLRQAARIRRDHAAVDIVGTVQTQEVRLAVAKILQLPDNVAPERIRDDPALLTAALAVDSACEMWGCMVYENVVDHRMLDRMVGGWVRATWRRLGTWVEAERIENRNPNIGEWWQWLYELIEADPDPAKGIGAHIAYRGKTHRRLSKDGRVKRLVRRSKHPAFQTSDGKPMRQNSIVEPQRPDGPQAQTSADV